MFVLVEMKDIVRIPPWEFNKPMRDAISNELRLKFANKVILNVGLCIELYEISKIEESHILPGDGASHTVVHFSYIVFRPFVNEVIVGKIRTCSKEGVHVSLGFFDDILIPPESLKHPSVFDEDEQVFIWKFSDEENEHDLFMDRDEPIRFCVTEESFHDTTLTGSDADTESEDNKKKIPYFIFGSIIEPGLGLLSWFP